MIALICKYYRVNLLIVLDCVYDKFAKHVEGRLIYEQLHVDVGYHGHGHCMDGP